VAKEGRTVLLVSHNMGAITQLCGTAVQLERGRLKRVGPSAEVVTAYLSSSIGTEVKSSWSNESSELNHVEVQFRSARLLSTDHRPISRVNFDSSCLIEIVHDVLVPVRELSIAYSVYDSQGVRVFESIDTDMPEWRGCVRERGRYLSICKILPSFLKPGRYYVSLASFVEGVKLIELKENVLSLEISDIGCRLMPKRIGIVSPVLEWKVQRFDEASEISQ